MNRVIDKLMLQGDKRPLRMIIGAGNTGSDLVRHADVFDLAVGGEIDEECKDLLAVHSWTGTPDWEYLLDVVGGMFDRLVVDWSVCSAFSSTDVAGIMSRLHDKASMYLPLRNLFVQAEHHGRRWFLDDASITRVCTFMIDLESSGLTMSLHAGDNGYPMVPNASGRIANYLHVSS